MNESVNLKQFESEETDAVQTSPYAWHDGITLSVAKAQGRPLDAASVRREGKLGRGIRVLDALYKYPFLDRCSLEACLSEGRGFEGIGSRQAYDHLRFLIEGGLAEPISVGDFRFYRLSPAARSQLKEAKGYEVFVPDLSDVSEVLETAALCRWHAHATAGGNCGINVVRQKLKFAGKELLVGSYVELKRSVRYRIFAFSSPRGSDFGAFADRLLEFWKVMDDSARRGQATVTLIVVPSISEMEVLDRLFSALGRSRGRRLHFALDARRGRDAYGFTGFYYFEGDGEGGTQLRSVSIG